MHVVIDQRSRPLRLPFCYICGEHLADNASTSGDHVPPKTVFAPRDRHAPLIIKVHSNCNTTQSPDDGKIGQLLMPLHGRGAKPNRLRLQPHRITDDRGQPLAIGFSNINITRTIYRWVRGLHAALYEEYLPPSRSIAIHPPFMTGKLTTPTSATVEAEPSQRSLFAQLLNMNRAMCKLDSLRAWNGKLTYECTWTRADNGHPLCVFALDLYGWHELGAIPGEPRRDCCGAYLASDFPRTATRASNLEFAAPNPNDWVVFDERG